MSVWPVGNTGSMNNDQSHTKSFTDEQQQIGLLDPFGVFFCNKRAGRIEGRTVECGSLVSQFNISLVILAKDFAG